MTPRGRRQEVGITGSARTTRASKGVPAGVPHARSASTPLGRLVTPLEPAGARTSAARGETADLAGGRRSVVHGATWLRSSAMAAARDLVVSDGEAPTLASWRSCSTQRSVSDATIAMQVKELLSEQEVEALTKRLEKQGLLAESEFAAGRWHVTDAGRSALDAE